MVASELGLVLVLEVLPWVPVVPEVVVLPEFGALPEPVVVPWFVVPPELVVLGLLLVPTGIFVSGPVSVFVGVVVVLLPPPVFVVVVLLPLPVLVVVSVPAVVVAVEVVSFFGGRRLDEAGTLKSLTVHIVSLLNTWSEAPLVCKTRPRAAGSPGQKVLSIRSFSLP